MGFSLMEELAMADRKVTTLSFGDCKIPNIKDIPTLRTLVLERPLGPGPYHSMAIGETPVIPVAAAIANAIDEAVGVRIKSLPITAEKVFQELATKTVTL